jgi:hypothetical protein
MRKTTFTFLHSLTITAMLGVLFFGTSGCNNMPNNGVPFYLAIDSPTVSYTYPFGSTSHSIPGVWATVGSHNLGAYEMPVKIPVLSDGSALIAISAGIHDNGIINAPAQYPFYNPDTFTIYNAIPGHVYHHHPVYSYVAGTQFAVIEGFDNSNNFKNVTVMRNTADSSVYEGLGSGGIIIPSGSDSILAYQTVPVQINTNGRQAYVELNYKMNNQNVFCDVGVIATKYSGGSVTEQTYYPKITLVPSKPYWNKIYLNFNTEVGSNPNYYFQVYFLASHTQGQQDTMFIDNVKLLYLH